MMNMKYMTLVLLFAAGCSGAAGESGSGEVKQGAGSASDPANDPCAGVRVASDGVCGKDAICDPDCVTPPEPAVDGCASGKIGPGMGPDPDCAPPSEPSPENDGCASAKIGPGMGPDPDCAPPTEPGQEIPSK